MSGVQMGDVAQHIHGNRSARASIDAVIEAVISRFSSVNNADERDAAVKDLRENKAQLVDAVFANVGAVSYSHGRRIDPSETPTLDGDHDERLAAMTDAQRSDEAERLGNPVLPYDASGHKMHPSDALSPRLGNMADRTPYIAPNAAPSVTGERTLSAGQSLDVDARAASVERYRVAAEKGLATQRERDQAAQQNGPVV